MPIPIDTLVRLVVQGQNIIDRQLNLQVEAVDDMSLDVPDGAADQQVDIQPGPATDISFIAIHNVSGLPSISYRASIGGAAIPLADVHVYSGPGMAALLGANPTALYFSNPSGQAVSLRIVVGRAA